MFARGLIVAGLFLTIGGTLIPVARMARADRRYLLLVMAVALAVRLVLVLSLQHFHPWSLGRGAVTPDELGAEHAALTYRPGHSASLQVITGSLYTAWVYLAWAVYGLWKSLLALKLVNIAFGVVTVVPGYLLAADVAGRAVARVAAWFVALLPTGVVWSVLGLRDTFIVYLIVVFLFAVNRLVSQRQAALPETFGLVLLAAAVLLVMTFTRGYMVPLLLGLAGLEGLVSGLAGRHLRPVLSAVAVGVVAFGAITALPQGRAITLNTTNLLSSSDDNVYDPFTSCSATGTCVTTTTVAASPRPPSAGPPPSSAPLTASLQSVSRKGVVKAFAIAVLDGRPVWRRAEYFFMLQPGVWIWWAALPLVVAGLVALLARRAWAAGVLLGSYCLAIVIFLAVTGQFIRHHYMMEIPAGILAAVGVVALPRAAPRARWVTVAACVAMAAAATGSVLLSLVHPATY
ncbi:MAG TPA: hypothetical protein VFH45_08815 [Acidimicrobiales bacterium]|nr:hypothetical protein [Acidimicrobiales bacterium]